ncbi:Secretory carrier-associated membrane protein 6 [Hibiscus syriacus]|uniref:Secretory carrier-associated membrane protein 6 n=1 Tax=Hibiscus syriacus TaxID=106335 RepID=A0A6A3CV37_HIBSY|nr:Secretory carrier-associated membrane protein 6 [Hibiscus syriacus]
MFDFESFVEFPRSEKRKVFKIKLNHREKGAYTFTSKKEGLEGKRISLKKDDFEEEVLGDEDELEKKEIVTCFVTISHHDPNPFDEEVNLFSNGGGVAPARPLASEPWGFGKNHDATVDIHLDTMNDSKKREKELAAWEADLKRREKDIKRREDVVSQTGVSTDDKNWPPLFPIIHHDIVCGYNYIWNPEGFANETWLLLLFPFNLHLISLILSLSTDNYSRWEIQFSLSRLIIFGHGFSTFHIPHKTHLPITFEDSAI